MAFNKIASFFRTKRPNMLVGSVKGKEFDALVEVVKEARGNPDGVVFFFFLNDDPKERGPVAGMSIAVGTPREGFTGRKPTATATAPVAAKVDPLAGLFGGGTAGGGKIAGEDW